MSRTLTDVQDRLDKEAEKKMKADWQKFQTAFNSLIRYEVNPSKLLRYVPLSGSTIERVQWSTIIDELGKCFVENALNKYKNEENQLFMEKFNQMSEQFEDMIGFTEEAQNE